MNPRRFRKLVASHLAARGIIYVARRLPRWEKEHVLWLKDAGKLHDDSQRLQDLAASLWLSPDIMRIYGNLRGEWGGEDPSYNLLKQLGAFPPCPCGSRSHRFLMDNSGQEFCNKSGRPRLYIGWKPAWGEPSFEITCLASELEQLAELATAIACGDPLHELEGLPGQHLLNRPLSKGVSYLWTFAAREQWQRKIEREKDAKANRERRSEEWAARALGAPLPLSMRVFPPDVPRARPTGDS